MESWLSLQTPLHVLNWAWCCRVTMRNSATFGKEILMGYQLWHNHFLGSPSWKTFMALWSGSLITLNIKIALGYLFLGHHTPPPYSVTTVSSVSTCWAVSNAVSLFLRRTCEAARSNPAENSMWKKAKHNTVEISLQGLLRFSLLVIRCCSSTCPRTQHTALRVMGTSYICLSVDIGPECVAHWLSVKCMP